LPREAIRIRLPEDGRDISIASKSVPKLKQLAIWDRRLAAQAMNPPFTSMIDRVIKPASGPARKTIAAATSLSSAQAPRD
jgi:hypothetical protein